jgi:hypothetical protein
MALNQILDRTRGELRRTAKRAARVGRGVVSNGNALRQKVTHMRPQAKPGMDDVTLARKVETEIFRDEHELKGKIDVNTVDGIVWLRGEAKNPAQLKSIEAKTRKIPEVRDVENLLHLPKTPPPKRPRRTTAKRQEAKAEPRRFDRAKASAKTDDATSKAAGGEPTPTELASERSGRKPAPLGADDGGETPTT